MVNIDFSMNAHVAQWIGCRERQEDAYVLRHFPTGLLVVVCDGMGGHHMGAVASRTAADAFVDAFTCAGEELVPAARLRHALETANDTVREAFAGGEELRRYNVVGCFCDALLALVGERGGFSADAVAQPPAYTAE